MGSIKDLTRASWYNKMSRYGYVGVGIGINSVAFNEYLHPLLTINGFLCGLAGLVSVVIGSAGTTEFYYDLKKVMKHNKLEQIGHVCMPCSRGAVRMLIADYKDNKRIKQQLEQLLLPV